MGVLSNLEPSSVVDYCEEICSIPHTSHHEKALSDYCVQFAKAHGLACRQDEMGNVLIKAPATPGYEKEPGLILQGHLHKVGDKTSRERRVLDLIEMVGLPNSVLDALPGQLSGGQQQRVAIARALSLEPDAIIADEPTSALDVSVRAQILNLLMDLKRDLGLSMVFISHDIQTVRYISDQIIVMNAGEAVERSAAKDVFEHPKDAYTKLLLGAAPSLLHPELGK